MRRAAQLIGLKIYTDRAKYVGTVEDVLIDDRAGTVAGLVIDKREGRVVSVPYNSVIAVGDIILVQSRREELAGAAA